MLRDKACKRRLRYLVLLLGFAKTKLRHEKWIVERACRIR
jgi:hypothetical protein